jgi:hypothetical protein
VAQMSAAYNQLVQAVLANAPVNTGQY